MTRRLTIKACHFYDSYMKVTYERLTVFDALYHLPDTTEGLHLLIFQLVAHAMIEVRPKHS